MSEVFRLRSGRYGLYPQKLLAHRRNADRARQTGGGQISALRAPGHAQQDIPAESRAQQGTHTIEIRTGMRAPPYEKAKKAAADKPQRP